MYIAIIEPISYWLDHSIWRNVTEVFILLEVRIVAGKLHWIDAKHTQENFVMSFILLTRVMHAHVGDNTNNIGNMHMPLSEFNACLKIIIKEPYDLMRNLVCCQEIYRESCDKLIVPNMYMR